MAEMVSLVCAWCDCTFDRPAWVVRRSKPWQKTYCCNEHRVFGKKRAQYDFWSLVKKGGENDCWPWFGGLDGNGYGGFEEKGKYVIAHRRAYEMEYGPIPDGKGYHGTVIRHRCDNPPYGISQSTHSFIINRKTWKHI